MTPADIQLTQVQPGTTNGDRPETGGDAWRSAWQKEMERLQAREWFGHGIVGAAASPDDQAQPTPVTAMPPNETQRVTAATAVLAQLAPSAAREAFHAGGQHWPQTYKHIASFEIAGELNGDLHVSVGANLQVNAGGVPAQAAGPAQPPGPLSAIDVIVDHLLAALPGMLAHSNGGAPGVDATVPVQRTAMSPAMAVAPSSRGSSPIAKVSPPPNQPSSKTDAAAQQQSVERQGVRLHAEWTSEGVRLWLGMDVSAAIPAAMLLLQLQRSVAALGTRLLSLTCNGRPVPMNGSPETISTTEMETPPWQSTQ